MAAPTVTTNIQHNIKLTNSKEGIRAFAILFPAVLGRNLSKFLMTTIENNDYDDSDSDKADAFEAIYYALVPCLADHPDLLIRMTQDCNRNGAKCFAWLMHDIDPNTSVSNITTLIDVISTPLATDDIIKSINDKVKKNKNLKGEFHLNDVILTTLLLIQLPANYNTLRDIIVEKDNLPSIKDFVTKIKNTKSMAAANNPSGEEHAVFFTARKNVNNMMCFNCDKKGHVNAMCREVKSDCDVCGLTAGHLTKFCLVKSDKPIPATLPDSIKEKIAADRKIYKEKNTALMLYGEEPPEDFWSMLEKIQK